MASIDKTYCSWSEYQILVEWCKNIEVAVYPNGRSERLSEWLDFELPENYFFDKDGKPRNFPVWNTPWYFDCWLARNCELKFIQDTLKGQYDEEYESMVNGTSIYDKTFQKNNRNGSYKFTEILKINRIAGKPNKTNFKMFNSYYKKLNKGGWYIKIQQETEEETEYWRYDSISDSWHSYLECVPTTDNYYLSKNIHLKSLIRKIRKWNLIGGLKIYIEDMFSETKYILQTK